jgi:hypothetical protein
MEAVLFRFCALGERGTAKAGSTSAAEVTTFRSCGSAIPPTLASTHQTQNRMRRRTSTTAGPTITPTRDVEDELAIGTMVGITELNVDTAQFHNSIVRKLNSFPTRDEYRRGLDSFIYEGASSMLARETCWTPFYRQCVRSVTDVGMGRMPLAILNCRDIQRGMCSFLVNLIPSDYYRPSLR